MLRLVGIEKSYGSFRALDGVSLHVREGDCYGFLGHNGAGKTTALRIALGLIRADAGSVFVGGFDAAEHPREARARQGGLIETPGFYPWRSGASNLRVLSRLRGRTRRDARREAERLLDAVGLSSAGDRRVGGYSQGMRQRLGIAQALIGDPALILLDEPTNGLDPEGIEEFRRLLARLTKDERRTVLLSSHQLKELSGVCNRIGILKKGRLLVEGETGVLTGTAGRRHVLRTDDPAAACEVLRGLGATPEEPVEDLVEFDAGEVAPAAIAKALVARDVEVRELAARTESLNDIYLRYSSGEGEAAPRNVDPAPTPITPPEVMRPRFGTLAAFRQEVGRITSHPGPIVALLIPVLVAVLSVVRQWAIAKGHLAQVTGGELYSQTLVTAFEGVAAALQNALPVGALVVVGLASQSLAGEFSRGTLRNLLLTPVGRWRLALGKALGVLAVAVGCYALTVGAAVLASTIAFDFTDVVELLEIDSAEPWIVAKASELWPEFLEMLPVLLVPFAAYASFGFLCGALLRSGVTSFALAAGGFVAIDLSRVAGREFDFEPALLSAHLPSPLGDTSWTARMQDLIQAPNDIPGGFVDAGLSVPAVWLVVPAIWLVLSVGLAVLAVSRRSVP